MWGMAVKELSFDGICKLFYILTQILHFSNHIAVLNFMQWNIDSIFDRLE